MCCQVRYRGNQADLESQLVLTEQGLGLSTSELAIWKARPHFSPPCKYISHFITTGFITQGTLPASLASCFLPSQQYLLAKSSLHCFCREPKVPPIRNRSHWDKEVILNMHGMSNNFPHRNALGERYTFSSFPSATLLSAVWLALKKWEKLAIQDKWTKFKLHIISPH